MSKEYRDLREYFKVGDSVKLRDDLVIGKEYMHGYWFVKGMEDLIGKAVKVDAVGEKEIRINVDSGCWFITEDMIEFEKPFDFKAKFAKLRDDAIIPSKRDEDADYDLYARFDEDYVVIQPNQVVQMFTGLISAFPKDWMAKFEERGSTGFKCMSVRAGEMDSGYRDEWIVLINNTSNTPILITKEKDESNLARLKKKFKVHSYDKAIAQFGFYYVPKVDIVESTIEEVKAVISKRGNGRYGSSGK